MSYIETNPIKNTTIMLIYAEKDKIKLDPDYQRRGGVWPVEKKQLLVDSILNDYDIPKIYFHEYERELKLKEGISYSVIDGRQRLESIWEFIEGAFNLSPDFEYLKDDSIKLAGLSYEDIAKEHPIIRIKFDSFVLPIVGISTDDLDLIEDMFSRLNEAVPLNAAEKRNAFNGYVVKAIREISKKVLFKNQVKFKNNRYQHMEVVARLLLIENSLQKNNKLIDTMKASLDNFVKEYAKDKDYLISLTSDVSLIIELMEEIFTTSDELLRAQGNMVIYYLLFRKAIQLNEENKITRRKLLDFQRELVENRKLAERDYSQSAYELLEYDRLTQQGTNNSSNIRERLRVISEKVGLSSSE